MRCGRWWAILMTGPAPSSRSQITCRQPGRYGNPNAIAAGSPPNELQRLAARVPFPVFFVAGAMIGILFAMAIVIAARGPRGHAQPSAPVAMSSVTAPASVLVISPEPDMTHAKLLFVWRPEAVANRAAAPSMSFEPSTSTAGTVAATPSPRPYRVASARHPGSKAPSMPSNLLSAGL